MIDHILLCVVLGAVTRHLSNSIPGSFHSRSASLTGNVHLKTSLSKILGFCDIFFTCDCLICLVLALANMGYEKIIRSHA